MTTTSSGFAAAGFEPVAEVFEGHFRDGLEAGAACAVYHRGQLVVDLQAGLADARTGRPWTPDTLTVVFSVTKGLLAICGYLACQRGLLDFDAPVTSVWPEFGANGKERTTVRDLFAHRAGLIALDADLTLADLATWTPVITAIEEQKPLWEPGTEFSYHPLTFGWLTGEVLRRVTGLPPRELVREWLSGPLAVEAWIGLPASEEPRVARLRGPQTTGDPALARHLEQTLSGPAAARSMSLGAALPPTMVDGSDTDFNAPAVHQIQIPAANGITTATALARIYAATVSQIDGTPALFTDASIADATTVRSEGAQWPGVPAHPGIRFSTGFLVNGIPSRPLLSDSSFGHDGASGALAYADAATETGFGYVTNQFGTLDDQRANNLTRALRQCLGR